MQEKNTLEKPKNLWLLFISLVLIACGIYVLFNPATALVTSAVITGILFLLIGCGYIMEFRQCRSYMCPAIGILDIIIGIILLSNLTITATTMPLIFGFWCLFIGSSQFAGGLQLKDSRRPLGGLTMSSGLIGMIFGILILMYPIFGALTMTLLLGAYLIIYGVFELNRYFNA